MRYYLPFRTAIPHLKVDYLRVTHPFATDNHQFLPVVGPFCNFLLPFPPAFSLLDRPSDLHGSCTPLALILSQDQTLRKLFRVSRLVLSFGSLPKLSFASTTLQLLRCPPHTSRAQGLILLDFWRLSNRQLRHLQPYNSTASCSIRVDNPSLHCHNLQH
jgi:hypothetical protein